MQTPMDGFWLPSNIGEKILSTNTQYVTTSFCSGKACAPDAPGAITARWPVLQAGEWRRLVSLLQEGRQRSPVGKDYWARLESALGEVEKRFKDPADPLHYKAMGSIPGYTGFSKPMIQFTLNSLNLMTLDQIPSAYSWYPEHTASNAWQSMQGLPGRVLFTHAGPLGRFFNQFAGFRAGRKFDNLKAPDLVTGYGAGNVPGTALLITMLAQSTTMMGHTPPAVLVRNSRREPIFTPLVLSGLERIAPELVSGIAVLVWDYTNYDLQKTLLEESDLVIAAASDETITNLGTQISEINRTRSRSPIRFHKHGHKVSFSVISRAVTQRGQIDEASQQPLINVVSLLTALDSIFWDQYGCLSSRIHFIEEVKEAHYTALDYALKLTEQLHMLSVYLPRGDSPRRPLKDSFDRYKLLESSGRVKVTSGYEDDFLVVVDSRPYDALNFNSVVNACMGRVIFVRPVRDVMEFPDEYLRMLPPANLQSLSVAFGKDPNGLSDHFLSFSKACARRGVTAIRTIGRGAFPQLAYSWDGLLPLDLVNDRPRGYFTTFEFDNPYDEMIGTYRLFLSQADGLAVNES